MELSQRLSSQRSALALAIASVLAAPAAVADEAVTELGTIEISGERMANDVTVIPEERLDHYQASDLADVFASDPEVSVGGGQGLAEKVYIRGFVDSQVNVSIDGATQAGSLFHHTGRISVEPELLKQVEVQAGAGRATDGAGALAGAIRFETKDPTDLLRDGEDLGALVKLGYFSNTDGYRASTHLFGRLSDDWSALVSLSQSDHDNYEDGAGNEVEATESKQQLGFAKLVGEIGEAQTLRLSYEQHTDEGDRAQRPNWIVSSWNTAYPIEIERDTVTLNYELNPAYNEVLALDVTVYHSESEMEQNIFDRWGRYLGNTRSVGGDIRNTSRLGSHTLTYGVDYRDDEVTAGYAADPTAEKETGDVLGVYLQDDYAITDRLLLSAGLRYDRYTLTDNNDQDFDDDSVSPNVSVAYRVLPELNVYAGYAEAFRGPTPHGAFKLEGSSNDPDLEAEEARNTELGFDFTRGGFLLSGKVYRSEIDNAIGDQLFGPVVFTNLGDVESDGFLISAGYVWQAVTASLSYHNNDIELDGKPLTAYEFASFGNTIGDTWVADLEYRVNTSLQFGWTGRFVQRVDDI